MGEFERLKWQLIAGKVVNRPLLRPASMNCWPKSQLLRMEESASCRLLANAETRSSGVPVIRTAGTNIYGSTGYDRQSNPFEFWQLLQPLRSIQPPKAGKA